VTNLNSPPGRHHRTVKTATPMAQGVFARAALARPSFTSGMRVAALPGRLQANAIRGGLHRRPGTALSL
jgi:hypothetical protein